MKYGIHPSKDLVNIFKKKPFQGQDPTKARILIIGNDANYAPEISNHKFFFKKILEYHSDGIGFWRKYNVHHPFLLPEYPFDKRKGGVRYHLNFNKMQFSFEYADYFSFVELLNVPTIGNTGNDYQCFFDMLDKNHLNWLEYLIYNSERKLVLVNQTLTTSIRKIQKKYGVFSKLSQELDKLNNKKIPSIVWCTNNFALYNGYSFAHSISNIYLNNLGKTIREFINEKSSNSAEENPDLTFSLIKDILIGVAELEQDEKTEYKFG